MIKNAKKTEAQKQLIKFRNQLHTLLRKWLAGDQDGDVIAWMRQEDLPYPSHERVYLPTSGSQELISK